jgi:signal transduction histidine kinase
MTDPQTRVSVGTSPQGRDVATRPADPTGLPWMLQVFPIDPAVAVTSPRRPLLLAVLVSVAALLLAGWYFIWRGMSREVRVARLQSDFVAAVSHEFRSPLTSLGHIADLLATGRMGSEERKQRSYELLRGQTARLGQLVEGLLDFKTLQEGQFTFRFEHGDPAAIVRQVVSDFARQLDGDARRVDLRADEAVPAVRLDREAFGRALWNLLDNAVKYSPASARVEVSVSLDRQDDRIAITVKDEGPGIPVGEQGRIFDRFVRGAGATAGRIRGTGIGLAMARDIVRAHGGELTVASAPGAGSVFTIALPPRAPERAGA